MGDDNNSADFDTDDAHQIHLRILGERGVDTSLLDQTAECFARHPGPIRATVDPVPIDFEPDDSGLFTVKSFQEGLEQLSETKRSRPGEIIAVLAIDPGEEMWRILTNDSDPKAFLCYTYDFHEGSRIPMGVVAAHFVLQGILEALLVDADELANWHGEKQGCLFDFTESKDDVLEKLLKAGLCSECLELVLRAKIPHPLLHQAARIMNEARSLAVDTLQSQPTRTNEAANNRNDFTETRQ